MSDPLEKPYNRLKQAMLRDLLKNKQNVDEPYMLVKAGTDTRHYSRQQLADEIKTDTDEGIKMIQMMMNLAADLLLRGKI